MAVGDHQYVQNGAHALFSQDTDTPAEDSPDWNLRESFIARAVRAWENDPGYWWKELWKTLSAASPGGPGRTIIAAQVAYLCPSDFKFPGGFVWLTNASGLVQKKLRVIDPKKVQLLNEDTADEHAYFIGNPNSGYTLFLNPIPTTAEAGQFIVYNYYKRATEPSASTDFLEMSNPDFAIYHVLSTLYARQNDATRANNELATAQTFLEDMEGRNGDQPHWHPEEAEDIGSVLTGGFGN